ncbi:MAG: hypothetical protein IJD02_00905 [Lachnospiraceae bacterium]|nr:hypothetical protein [Lachnospiraceae bacterium]
MKNYYKRKSLGRIVIICVAAIGILTTVAFVVTKKTVKEEKDTVGIYVLERDVKAGDEAKGTLKMVYVDETIGDILPKDVIKGNEELGFYKINLSKGVIVTNDMIQTESKLTNDIRLHNFSYVELNGKIERGDYVDIRISFNDGSDYIVLSKKRVKDVSVYNPVTETPNELWLDVSEEELLRMSSAAYDGATKENCRLYAVEYISELQEEAYITYPVNQIVAALIESDPNIAKQMAQILDDKIRENIDELSNNQSFDLPDEETQDKDKDTFQGSESPNKDETLNNNNQSLTPENDDSLVYDIDDDKEIQYLD